MQILLLHTAKKCNKSCELSLEKDAVLGGAGESPTNPTSDLPELELCVSLKASS